MAKNNVVRIILINCMAAPRLKRQMVKVIGGITRSIRKKDMLQCCILMVTDTWGNSCRMKDMVMEYTDGQMEEYIVDNSKRVTVMAMDTKGSLMEQNIMDNSRMITFMETECGNRMANYSKSNLKKAN